ncbi:UDP-2,4-diacetamido-2,4,6-trideoxy-beta-L-altropyranose hydrolase [Leptolyngbya sp. 'hensonii']|uniref:UDP-2,4-diacetamido-2,4, 6-trideoxy-beta-L-altropyranose hydrolase n=1 Tax=Leptolyngbya sp. 'hensonii' TaxID=1922337 RepID=UPI00094FAB0B|nr:UDP-2,4-diacetamido-2,4,6-trideoxy-beta-L-altropyranose hydrolase [Leptolyngbya sp. 'hensonii']OLP15643.1 UDP-2,4-diacetamido-2,4,6-trideoxy-beta-L-altropyranose hydrolase [Leptolyngbya sp. 'hensonii']
MKIVLRADSSIQMGTGHVMRCLTLAIELRERGHNLTFVCRDLPGNLVALLEARGFPVQVLPAPDHSLALEDSPYARWLGVPWEVDAAQTQAVIPAETDWLILDHYGLDARWERRLRSQVGQILVIDDLANRSHDCDLLLDQNFYANQELRYQGLVPAHCRCLLGPQYTLLRSEFLAARQTLQSRAGELHRVLVAFGGSDPTNETAKVLAGIALLQGEMAVDVVVGQAHPELTAIAQLCSERSNWTYHCQIDYMAKLMVQADLAIGAGGSTSWERCCLGLPALVAVTAENQLELTADLATWGAIVNLGWADRLTGEDYGQAIRSLTATQLSQMSQRGLVLVDGAGCSQVAANISL